MLTICLTKRIEKKNWSVLVTYAYWSSSLEDEAEKFCTLDQPDTHCKET